MGFEKLNVNPKQAPKRAKSKKVPLSYYNSWINNPSKSVGRDAQLCKNAQLAVQFCRQFGYWFMDMHGCANSFSIDFYHFEPDSGQL